MNFSEALKAMRVGSKVSRGVWKGGVYSWELLDGKVMAVYPSGLVEQVHSMMIEDILAEDWWIVT